jgi:hypothetical protein
MKIKKPSGLVPRVGSEEYKRRLKSATSKTELLTRGGLAGLFCVYIGLFCLYICLF